jgi:16S rRNA (uracil1498-N3)-methyltransferase
MHLFYTPDITNETYQLNEEESRHCNKVLRLQQGDAVNLIDGKGGLYTAHIVDSHPKHTLLKVVQSIQEHSKRNHYLHIAVAPTKNIDRFEWFLEKATEIGIDEITPLICDRSERREVKTDRLNKIITSAIKQSLKAYHPKLNEPTRFEKVLNLEQGEKFIAHCMESGKKALSDVIIKHGRYTVMIGPEGDFSSTEVERAVAGGFQPITLGSSRLRTETAALEACFEINFLNR